jgi:septum site-determining protein MinD
LGKKVTCIDSDIGLRNLDVVLGLENRIVYDLVDVIEGHCKVNQAMIRDKRFENLFLIPAAQTRDKNSVTPAEMVDLCESIRPEMDYILIDSPAGIEGGFKNAIAPADEAIVITNPDVSAVRDADRIIGLIEAAEKGPARLILNRINPEMTKRGDMMEAEDVLELLAIKLLGIVPDDENVLISTNKGQPVVLNQKSRAGQAFRNIAARITGNEVPFLNMTLKDDFMTRLSKVFNKEG